MRGVRDRDGTRPSSATAPVREQRRRRATVPVPDVLHDADRTAPASVSSCLFGDAVTLIALELAAGDRLLIFTSSSGHARTRSPTRRRPSRRRRRHRRCRPKRPAPVTCSHVKRTGSPSSRVEQPHQVRQRPLRVACEDEEPELVTSALADVTRSGTSTQLSVPRRSWGDVRSLAVR